MRTLLELLDEDGVVDGQVEGQRQKVEHLLVFQRVFLDQLFAHFLDVFGQVVFSRKLEVVSEVVHVLVPRKVHVVHFLGDPLFIRPNYVPVEFDVRFAPASADEGGLYGVVESGFEFYLVSFVRGKG